MCILAYLAGENAPGKRSRDRERVWEGHRKTLNKYDQSGEPGWITADAMQGSLFVPVCLNMPGQGFSCIDVLLSAGSANKTKGDRYMGR